MGVDVGGTKTLVAVLDAHGVIIEKTKFPTPTDYQQFLFDLAQAAENFAHDDFRAGGVGIPAARIDRPHGIGVVFANLPWKNVPVQQDLEKIFHCPFVLENDAKLGGLSEAMLLQHKFKSVLYLTISTGIGLGLTVNGEIDPNVGDGGGRTILLEHKGQLVPWEDFASGRAIVERYGKMAMEITDKATWRKICRDLAQGMIELIAIAQPEVIVIGGSVGTYFERYHELLAEEIKRYHIPLITLPKLRQAQRPEEAVVYGCYDLAKATYPPYKDSGKARYAKAAG